MYKFSAASKDESIVYGSAKPGYPDNQVEQWIEFMQRHDIQRICCLLSDVQLKPYADLLGTYGQVFGTQQICWAPIEDFNYVDPVTLMDRILPFLAAADQQQEKVVVHCAGGIGRTGHVLAAWLVAGRQLSNSAAIAAVREMGRNPYEAVLVAPFKGKNPWTTAATLDVLLNQARHYITRPEADRV